MGRPRTVSRAQGEGLVDLLDRLLAVGVTVSGGVVIRLADVDLVNLDLRLLLASVRGTPAAGGPARRPAIPSAPAALPAAGAGGAPEGQAAPAAARGREPGLDPSRESLNKGLGRLVVAIAELVRQLLERQAIRRKRAGSLDPGELEDLGNALRSLEQQTAELREVLGVEPSDVDEALGTIEGALQAAHAEAPATGASPEGKTR